MEKVTKTSAVKEAIATGLQENPEIVAWVKEHRKLDVTAAYVSGIKTGMKKKGELPSNGTVAQPSSNGTVATGPVEPRSNGTVAPIAVDTTPRSGTMFAEIAVLAGKAGGIDKLRDLVTLLAK